MTAKILIIDDDKFTREVLRKILERDPLIAKRQPEIFMAADGVAGVEVFERERPGLVIVDLFMPKMDGFAVCKRLRELASARAFAASLPHLYRVEESASPMGPMLRKSMTNVTHPASDQDPFPLAMRFVDAPGEVRTVAESRLFARSPDRFEVVAVAGLRAGATPREIELVRELVSTFADDLTASLQDCTATMPRRTR